MGRRKASRQDATSRMRWMKDRLVLMQSELRNTMTDVTSKSAKVFRELKVLAACPEGRPARSKGSRERSRR